MPALEHKQPVDLTALHPQRRSHGRHHAGLRGDTRHGAAGLPADTIRITFTGSAGQSFGAFVPRGMTMTLVGDANDGFGKGLSGGRLIVFPPRSPRSSRRRTSSSATSRSTARPAVKATCAASPASVLRSQQRRRVVVEGVGDHGCEYMTGGRVVVLGRTGRNFAAGMSGGIAYVLDTSTGTFQRRCNARWSIWNRSSTPRTSTSCGSRS